MFFIDTHAHLTGDTMWPLVEEVLKRSLSAQLQRIVVIATCLEELQRALDLKKKHPFLSVVASTTPHDASAQEDPFFEAVQESALNGSLVAIGETGLEYFHEGLDHQRQKEYLQRYVALANQALLPMVFHCRDGFSDLLEYTQELKTKALIHCFTGTLDEAKSVLDRGWSISISGIVTFKKSVSLQECVRYIPLDRLLIETDAPYLSPQSKRGKMNEPAFIVETYEYIAALKGITLGALCEAIQDNVIKFFSSSKVG